MFSLRNKKMVLGTLVATATGSAVAFQPTTSKFKSSATKLNVAVDPGTVTTKEYQDICGVSFDDDAMMERLKSTKFLYPKHVEVIEDIAPIADAMVDEIVSQTRSPIGFSIPNAMNVH